MQVEVKALLSKVLQQSPPTDFMEALTGLINTYSKNGPLEQ